MKARPSKLHIRRGDMVMAISGEDADGKKVGKVLQVFPSSGRAVVEGFNFVRKHLKKSQDNPQGGVIDKEAPIAVSKLKLHTRGEARKKAATR